MSDKTSGGGSFTDALTIALIVLKLCGVITWSWVWGAVSAVDYSVIDVLLVMIALMAYGWRK